MATNRNFYLDNQLSEPPVNADEIAIQFNFDKDAAIAKSAISINRLSFARENNDKILKHYLDGKTFEGQPFKMTLTKDGLVETPINGYVDHVDNPEYSNLQSTVTVKPLHQIDWINDVADSVSFEYLASIGKITADNYLYMPYVISSIPNYKEAFMALLSVAIIGNQLLGQINDLTQLSLSLGNPFEAITAILRVIVNILFIIGLIIALVVLIKDMILFLVQPVKYHACMRWKTLAEIGASHFGLTFKSDIFDNAPFKDEVLLPQKSFNPPNSTDDRILGYTFEHKDQTGYPKATFGEFLRWMKIKFKAKIIITEDKELLLVREDYSPSVPQFQIPDLYQPDFTTNAHELKANYLIQFATDLNDKNTIQEYKGTTFQVITSQNTTIAPELNLLKDLETVSNPFALAKRKTELTLPEKIIKEFLSIFGGLMNGLIDIVNFIIKVVNAILKAIRAVIKALKVIGIKIKFDPKPIKKLNPVDTGQSIDNRIGMLKIENEFVVVPKTFIISQGSESKFNKIAESNSEVLSARYLWNNYHGKVVSFIPSVERPNGNQYIIKEVDKVPFEFGDFRKVKNNNHCYTSDGKQAIIDSGEWRFNSNRQDAKLKVRISQLYTTALKETYLEPDGQ